MTEDSVRSDSLRLALLRGIYSALRRHGEVLSAISASADRAEANAAIRSLLGLDRAQADAVLEIGWNRLTANGIHEVEDEIARFEASLGNDPIF